MKKGKCCVCGQLTNKKYRFSDDWDEDEKGNVTSGVSYLDFCHEECYENLMAELR